jgi:hypothetical protein
MRRSGSGDMADPDIQSLALSPASERRERESQEALV